MAREGRALLHQIKDRATRELVTEVMNTPDWETEAGPKGYVRITAPDGDRILVHTTPSDWRSVMNVRSRLRRMGWNPYRGDAEKERREERMRQVREEEQQALAAAQTRIDQEETEHAEVEQVIGMMTMNGAEPANEEMPREAYDDWDPEYRMRWEFAPEGPPPSRHNSPESFEKGRQTRIERGQIVPIPKQLSMEEVPPTGGVRSAAKLRETTFDQLVAEDPPPKRNLAKQRTMEAATALVLDLVTQAPGQWRKLPEMTTKNAGDYLRDAGRELGVKVTTRLTPVEGIVGWLYVKAEEVTA